MDGSFLIVESFDETVYHGKEEEPEEDADDEQSLETIKANMDRILAQVGLRLDSGGKKSQDQKEEFAQIASQDPAPSEDLPSSLSIPETIELKESTQVNEIDPEEISNVMPDFMPHAVPGQPNVPAVGVASVLPVAATSITGELIHDMSQFEPEIVPGQIENTEHREKNKVKGRRTGRINYNEGGETQDFYPLPRSNSLSEGSVYEPPAQYGVPLPTTLKLLGSITFGSLVSIQHTTEQKPAETTDHLPKKSRGRPRTLPCPPMEALQQELALGNVEFSVSGGSIAMLASSNSTEKPKRKRKSCIHGRDKGKCRECGGISFCIHQRYKYTCIDCGGPGVCEHKRRRAECKDCKGGSVCIHNRIRRRCGDCGGKAKCEHKRLKWQCKDCHGSSICHHNKRKHSCKLCRNEQMRLNAAAVLLELPGREKSIGDNGIHVGHNGVSNVPSIGGVVSNGTSMVEDYSYRSGDLSFAETAKAEPPPLEPVVLDANGNPVKIAKNLSAGRKPRKLRMNRMIEAAEEEARNFAKEQATKAADIAAQQLNNVVNGDTGTDAGNTLVRMNPYPYMQLGDNMMPLPTGVDGLPNYSYLNGSQALPTPDVYGIMRQQQTSEPWMEMVPLNVGVDGNDDQNSGITIDGSSITIINNGAEEGKVS